MKTRMLISATEIRSAAMDLLARREHSRQELVRKLQARVEDPQALAQALDRLIEDNLLDEARFCEAFVRSRINGGYGPRRLGADLKERGIGEPLFSQAMDVDEQQWQAQLLILIEKKYGSHLESDAKNRAKQQRFLMQRGFTYQQICIALTQFTDS